MAALINAVYPSFNNTANYSGVNSAIQSAGLVSNPEHHDTVLGLERTGQLGLSQFGLIRLPREVLMLQDDRGAKLKAPQVSSSTQSDLDEQRTLDKVDDGTTPDTQPKPVTARKDSNSNNDPIEQQETTNRPTAADDTSTHTPEQKAARRAETHEAAQAFQQHAASTSAPHVADAKKKEDSHKSRPTPTKAASLLGRGSTVYQGVIASYGNAIAGRNLDVQA
jgi:hypothetical protein